MKRLFVILTLIAGVATPAFAYRDKDLQKAVDKASGQMQKGKPEEAVATVEKVAAKLGTGEAYLALGRVQQQALLMDEAVASYAKAREREKSDPEVLLALARITLSTGSATDALVPAERAVAIAPSPEALAILALVQLRRCDLAKAQDAADRALAAGPTSPFPHLAQGQIQLTRGHPAEAIGSFRRALELDPNLVEARIGLAAALGAAGQSAEAVAEAGRAASEDPTSGEAPALQGLLMLAGHEGDAAFWAKANEVALEGVLRNPHSAVVEYLVGRVFEARPYPDFALQHYKKALAIDPKLLPARLALTKLLVADADVATAFTMAKEMVADAPWNGEAQFLYGRELLRRKDAAQALAALEKATQLAPEIAEAHALLATAAFFSGSTEQAVAESAKALALRPDQLEWRADYGLFLGRNGDYEKAAAELQKVVSSPGYKQATGFINLGWVYRNSQPPKLEESIRAYQRALEIDPKQAQAALGLGWAYFGASRYDESIAAYEKAVALDAALAAEVYDGIAWDYYFQKDMLKAKESLAKAKAAGRDDVRLARSIDAFEKKAAQPPGPTPAELRCAAIDAQIRSKDGAVRAQGIAELRTSGCTIDDMPGFLTRVLASDDSYMVKQAAAESLGKMGAAARQAIPYLEQCQKPCDFPVIATLKQMEEEAECSRARSACARALDKIR